jgi:D-alanine-D-alanine ligase-like ATP-grasp enzyme
MHIQVLIPIASSKASWTVEEDEYTLDQPWLSRSLAELGYTFSFHPITLLNASSIIASFPKNDPNTVIFNLCDGTEEDGRPGNSVLEALQSQQLRFTGANLTFNILSSSKSATKSLLSEFNVLCPRGFSHSGNWNGENTHTLKYPMIIKPDASYGAIGVNLVQNPAELTLAVEELVKDFGSNVIWVAEEYIQGREFTALVVDAVSEDGSIFQKVYPVLERIFDSKLKPTEQFFSKDVYWNHKFSCALAPQSDMQELEKVAKEAYLAVGGNGYARVDLRMSEDRDIYVLEVNSLCGISDSSDSSVGMILKFSQLSVVSLVEEFIQFAIKRK